MSEWPTWEPGQASYTKAFYYRFAQHGQARHNKIHRNLGMPEIQMFTSTIIVHFVKFIFLSAHFVISSR